MKVTVILSAVYLLIISSNTFSQTSIYLSGNGGYYLYHYDNTLPLTENTNLKFSKGLTFGLMDNFGDSFHFILEVGYSHSKATEVSKNNLYGSDYTSIDLIQNSFPIDISFTKNLSPSLTFGIGLSLEAINHNISTHFINENVYLEDKINLFSMGLNSSINYFLPLDTENNLKLFTGLKFRYLYSIIRTAEKRDLSDFNHNFLQSTISVGLCYNL